MVGHKSSEALLKDPVGAAVLEAGAVIKCQFVVAMRWNSDRQSGASAPVQLYAE